MGNSVIVPLGVMRPILLPSSSANQRLPSGPAVMAIGVPGEVGMGNSVIVPLGVMRPILLPSCSANQRLPSGPAVMALGLPGEVGMRNSEIVPFRCAVEGGVG